MPTTTTVVHAPMPHIVPGFLTGSNGWLIVLGIFGLCILLKLLMRRPPGVRPLSAHGRISAFLGQLGQGKTYTMVKSALAQLEAGADVATNFSLHVHHLDTCPEDCDRATVDAAGKWIYVRTIEEVDQLRGEFVTVRGRAKCTKRVVLMLDEAEGFLAASGTRMGAAHKEVLKRLRKHGCDFLYSAQTVSQVPAMLRGITNEWFVCRTENRARLLGGKRRRFWATNYVAHIEIGKPKKAVYTMRHDFDPRVGDLYSTEEMPENDRDYGDKRSRALDARHDQAAAGADEPRQVPPAPPGGPAWPRCPLILPTTGRPCTRRMGNDGGPCGKCRQREREARHGAPAAVSGASAP